MLDPCMRRMHAWYAIHARALCEYVVRVPGASTLCESPCEAVMIDTSLLPSLVALLEEESVSGAAARAGVTQPAMSRTLARLRDALGDELLVKAGRGLERTS